MGSFEPEFPGFQILTPRDEVMSPLSRLQRRAPRPLQLKPSTMKPNAGGKEAAASSSTAAAVSSYFSSKDPIPLLSPLVLPSMIEPQPIQQETMAKSH
ncbi:hypothetical protein AAHA92_19041 [Salvia divinorum]|uniref:Uncharacterized protein n=1 Tax=Salvia divinorum TaxID=28513 RepID=A0ABD1H6V2_SALDI